MTMKIKYPYPCRICSALCNSPEESNFHTSYWGAIKFPICKNHTSEERRVFQQEEAYECQMIDADCNDCKHFKRGSRKLYRGDKVNETAEHGEYTRILVQHDVFYGHCMKFDKPTIATVNHATGRECFEHRRAQ